MPASRISNDALSADRPVSPPVQPENSRTKRFSMLKFRNFSESHLSARAKEDAAKQETAPPVPSLNRGGRYGDADVGKSNTDSSPVNTPTIVKTAPTFDDGHVDTLDHQQPPFTKQLEKTRSEASDMSRLSQDHNRSNGRATGGKSQGGTHLKAHAIAERQLQHRPGMVRSGDVSWQARRCWCCCCWAGHHIREEMGSSVTAVGRLRRLLSHNRCRQYCETASSHIHQWHWRLSHVQSKKLYWVGCARTGPRGRQHSSRCRLVGP